MLKYFLSFFLWLFCLAEQIGLCNFGEGKTFMGNYFQFRPVVQDMSSEDFLDNSIFSFVGHFVWRRKLAYVSLVDAFMGNILVKLS